ncbi:MAG: restriction endonuclease subunit S [Clostridia bacterium]|nr:restriction endonuclease subunit S [Clostridia bacterium]
MKVSDAFILHQGNGFELYNMNQSENSDILFVSRTAQNNGVVGAVDRVGAVKPFPAGLITVALGGSVLSSFVQRKPFYTAFHIMVLEPKRQMTFNEKLYYCMCIQGNRYRYSYGRQANRTLKDIDIPDAVPSWVNQVTITPITTRRAASSPALSGAWAEYRMGDLFRFVKGRRLTKEDMIDGTTNYLGAVSENNGVRQRIEVAPEDMSPPNCITVNYNGSVGEAFYQSEAFWASDDVNILYADGWTMNKYNALFIVTVIKANRYRFSYGRKWTLEKMKESIIKLPARPNGRPDFEYMEAYIKSLPYSDRI